jgi:lipoprotein signal peptidase
VAVGCQYLVIIVQWFWKLGMQSLNRSYIWPIIGLLLAALNLLLAYYFRNNASQFTFPDIDKLKWFFLSEPVFNWGGFFVDGQSPTIHRLPTVLFLLWASISLIRYLNFNHTKVQRLSAVVLLGGLGGLTLDILAYGSVCDWLGFSVPGAMFYSMLNLSDLMILFSAPVAALVCFERWLFKVLAFIFAMAVIGANTYYHIGYILFGVQFQGLS